MQVFFLAFWLIIPMQSAKPNPPIQYLLFELKAYIKMAAYVRVALSNDGLQPLASSSYYPHR